MLVRSCLRRSCNWSKLPRTGRSMQGSHVCSAEWRRECDAWYINRFCIISSEARGQWSRFRTWQLNPGQRCFSWAQWLTAKFHQTEFVPETETLPLTSLPPTLSISRFQKSSYLFKNKTEWWYHETPGHKQLAKAASRTVTFHLSLLWLIHIPIRINKYIFI